MSKIYYTVESFSSLCSWGYVHPRLLSVPELCHYLAEGWITGDTFMRNLLGFKRQNPGKVKICSTHIWYGAKKRVVVVVIKPRCKGLTIATILITLYVQAGECI